MTTKLRYNYSGLYCPKAKDFLPPEEEMPQVADFLDVCCVRLERLFPDVPHVASLVQEMRTFSKSDELKVLKVDAEESHKQEIAEKDERIDELEHEVGALREELSELQWQVSQPSCIDDTLPE